MYASKADEENKRGGGKRATKLHQKKTLWQHPNESDLSDFSKPKIKQNNKQKGKLHPSLFVALTFRQLLPLSKKSLSGSR